MERLERRAYEAADALVVNYRFVERLIEARYGRGLPVRMLPYTTETAFLPPCDPGPPRHLRPGIPLVLAVSRHDPRKGIHTLLRALAKLRDEGTAFQAVLAGGGALLQPHRRLARVLGLEPWVSLPGVVPDPRPYLASAACFVLPSLQEGSGSVSLLEAMETGAPAVVSRCDGIVEDAIEDESALLVRPGDASALAGAIGRLLADVPLQQRLRMRSRHISADRFAPSRFTAEVALYTELGLQP
jgi:glycosyltransferase involved in cell wall biosynthesis